MVRIEKMGYEVHKTVKATLCSDMSKLKCLVLIGPASVHTYRFLNGIAPYFDRVHLISGGDVPVEFRPENLAETLHVNFSIYNLKAERQIREFLVKTMPDVVHIHQANTIAFHSLRATTKLGIPSVLTAWGSDVLLLPETNPIMKSMVRYNLQHADWITSDSFFMSAKIRSLAGSNPRVSTINFGIDSDLMVLDMAKKQKMILSNRLHSKLYRVDLIIQAFAKLRSSAKLSGWVLTIAGSGEETANLKKLAAELNVAADIEFVGFLSQAELRKFYKISQLFISIPESDATSISLLEAMAAGCMPIVSNLPSNLEWIIDGINGFVVDDVNELDSIIEEAIAEATISTESHEIARFNNNLILKKADFRKNMQGYADILSKAVSCKVQKMESY